MLFFLLMLWLVCVWSRFFCTYQYLGCLSKTHQLDVWFSQRVLLWLLGCSPDHNTHHSYTVLYCTVNTPSRGTMVVLNSGASTGRAYDLPVCVCLSQSIFNLWGIVVLQPCFWLFKSLPSMYADTQEEILGISIVLDTSQIQYIIYSLSGWLIQSHKRYSVYKLTDMKTWCVCLCVKKSTAITVVGIQF